jgi:hypothetical protein
MRSPKAPEIDQASLPGLKGVSTAGTKTGRNSRPVPARGAFGSALRLLVQSGLLAHKSFLNQKSCRLRATMDFVRKILRLLFSRLQLLVFRRTFYANPFTHSGFGIDSIAVFNLQATEEGKASPGRCLWDRSYIKEAKKFEKVDPDRGSGGDTGGGRCSRVGGK